MLRTRGHEAAGNLDFLQESVVRVHPLEHGIRKFKNTKKPMKVKQHRWVYVLVFFAIGGFALAAAAYPRLARCRAYSKVVNRADASLNLQPQPTKVAIENPGASVRMSIGYADIGLPKDWAKSVTTHGSEVPAIQIAGEAGEQIVFMPPFFDTALSADGGYSWYRNEASSQRVSLAKVFMMSTAEFDELIGYTLPKSLSRYNQNGIGCFATEYVRGFIRFGPKAEPGNILVEVWSKRGDLSQGMLISSRDAESASRIVQCVLANLEYSVDDVPVGDVLQTLIRSELEKHDLFRDDGTIDDRQDPE
ncbi:MAG: hypothetical protein EA381_01285 [Planctomycetaceae bacterium]|nr:MAG: hypothetical protein EA381_01285 [Planctomycetaceae bacterium]